MLDSRMDIRVEWAHCDPATIVDNPHYFDWMDRGVHRLFAADGFRLEQMVRADPDFRGVPLVRVSALFRAPARVGDLLTLSTRVARFGNRSFDLEHRFFLDSALIVEGAQTRVWGHAGRARSPRPWCWTTCARRCRHRAWSTCACARSPRPNRSGRLPAA